MAWPDSESIVMQSKHDFNSYSCFFLELSKKLFTFTEKREINFKKCVFGNNCDGKRQKNPCTFAKTRMPDGEKSRVRPGRCRWRRYMPEKDELAVFAKKRKKAEKYHRRRRFFNGPLI